MASEKLDAVYRVVGPDGIGYYFSEDGALVRRVDKAVGYDTGSMSDHHPMPHDDGIAEVPSGYKFGFQSLENLKNWFTPDIMKAAAKENCEVQIWKVENKYVLGKKQLCFCETSAKKVETHPISRFIKSK